LALAATALTPASTASATSDDGAQAAALTGRIVVAQYNRELVSMRPDGTDRQRIANFADGGSVGPLDVTADGTRIAISPLRHRDEHIYTVNADGSDFKRVHRRGFEPTFSPDGSRIAFAGLDDDIQSLVTMKADGTRVTDLTTGLEPRPWYYQSWSPDGNHIAFVRSTRTAQAIVLTDPQGTWFRYVKTFQRKRGDVYELDWSPDSSEIVFARSGLRESGKIGSTDLWSITADDATITRLTDSPKVNESSPSFSPSGAHIACVRDVGRRRGSLDVVVMHADGSNRNRIQTAADEWWVAWGGTP
jgi:TolB protein